MAIRREQATADEAANAKGVDPREAASGAGERPLDPQHVLQIWLSPAFPTGAFAYSHGLETAVEQRRITSTDTLEAWLFDLLELGSLRNDLILASAAWRAAAAQDWPALRQVAELAAALQPCGERHLETMQQGTAFLRQVVAAWSTPHLIECLKQLGCAELAGGSLLALAYPVAFGLAAGTHAIPQRPALVAFALAAVGNLCSAAIRLSLTGETGAQGVIAALAPRLNAAAGAAMRSGLDALASATLRGDLVCLQHETQHTRLFRS
jgi:urease accessory protein